MHGQLLVSLAPSTLFAVAVALTLALTSERTGEAGDSVRRNQARSTRRRVSSGPAPRPVLSVPRRRGPPTLGAEEIVHIQGQRFLARSHYEDLKGAGLELLRRYRPDRHFFLALGRDPAPIAAFLQNLGGPNLAVNFTASGKGWPATSQQWARYFRALVPEHIFDSGRDIVLIDQTNAGSGRTIALFEPVMMEYLASIGSKAKVKKVGFSTGPLQNGVEHIDVAPYPDVGRYLYSPYEGVVSEYERHVPGSDTLETVLPRPAYQQYRAAVMDRMREDRSLREAIARIPGASKLVDPGPRFQRLPSRVDRELGTPLGSDYPVVRDLGVQALARFSPRDHFFLGVGQGSTPLLALLENVCGHEGARYLPADGLSETVAPEVHATYAHYLRDILPSDVIWGSRKLVVFLPAETEYRLGKVQELVSRYLPHARISVVGVGSFRIPGFPTLEVAAEQRALLARYRARAPFAPHRIGYDAPGSLRENPAYARLRGELGNHMAEDQELQRFLDRL